MKYKKLGSVMLISRYRQKYPNFNNNNNKNNFDFIQTFKIYVNLFQNVLCNKKCKNCFRILFEPNFKYSSYVKAAPLEIKI